MKISAVVDVIEIGIQRLASGKMEDVNDLSSSEYALLGDKCADLSRHLDNIAETFHIAASPECNALLAVICGELSKDIYVKKDESKTD